MVISQAARSFEDLHTHAAGAQPSKHSRPICRGTTGAMRPHVLVLRDVSGRGALMNDSGSSEGSGADRDSCGGLGLVTHESPPKMQATKKVGKRFAEFSPFGNWKETNMPIPEGTRQFVGLREVAERLGLTHAAVKHWWKEGRLIGRVTEGATRARVVVPIEVLNFYLRYFRLPTKRDLFELGALTREYLLELGGPDGGLSELHQDAGPVVTHH